MKLHLSYVAVAIFLLAPASDASAFTADHTCIGQFSQIPPDTIRLVRGAYRIFYGHTSHGSQLLTGMAMLRTEDSLYKVNEGSGSLSISEYGGDLGAPDFVTWAEVTRQHLYEPGNTTNLVIWSWCGQVSSASEEIINNYLALMTGLEAEFPNVKFIYMTGHLDGGGPTGNLYVRNNQIRAYCTANNKTLFDFADIESYDPSGAYYPTETDACAWCATWCATHTCPDCGGACAHSHCFNCYQKGKAFWWLLARLAGWTEGPCCEGGRGNVNCDAGGGVDISDLTALVDNLFISFNPLCCEAEANVDGAGSVDVADLTALIDNMFISFTPLAGCE